MLAQVYPYLDKPKPKKHTWRAWAEKTRRHLMTVKDATLDQYSHTYVRPYLGAEYPDSMVQATVLATLNAYEAVHGTRLEIDCLDQGLVAVFLNQTCRGREKGDGGDERNSEIEKAHGFAPAEFVLENGRLNWGGLATEPTMNRKVGEGTAHHYFRCRAAQTRQYKGLESLVLIRNALEPTSG